MPKYIIGIDEVGRGSLAGPVLATALALPKNLRIKIGNLSKIKDSKHLSRLQREILFNHLKNNRKVTYVTSRVTPKIIDRINITRAANRAATRAFLRLANSHRGIAARAKTLLDGGLYLDLKTLVANGYIPNPKTVIRGDLKINAIKLASVVAKVTRDRYMMKLHQKYPQYGFDKHKGYGTKKHKKTIIKYGPTPHHRLTFIKEFCRNKPSAADQKPTKVRLPANLPDDK